MRWEKYIDAEEVEKAIATLQAPGGVFEVRVLGTAKKDVLSGYFRDTKTLLDAFDTIDLRRRNVYITLGEVKEECFSRAQSERFLLSPQTSSDTEIVAYRWLFVDLDPVRTAGVSSSEKELAAAEELSAKVLEYMQSLGFPEPVKAMSGNGYHLLYRVSVPNDKDGRALMEKCLKVLAALFDSDKVKIDTTNSNPSRICKLHGTLAQKGTSTSSRPHRMSRLLSVPDEVRITSMDALQKLAAELPDEPQQDVRRRNDYGKQDFDLLEFLRKNGMTYEEDSNDRAKIFRLDHCPFDHNHKDGDAKIFWYTNGAIAFKCHHNSCRNYKWQDVRLKFEPDAYDAKSQDDERIDAGYREHIKKKSEEAAAASMVPQAQEKPQKTRKIRKLKTAEALMQKDLPEPKVFVGVGDEVPLLTEGTCIVSAKPKLGKSWMVLSMCVAVSNGEDFLGYKTNKCSTLYLDLETSEILQKKRLKKVLKGRPVPKNFYLETETNTIEDGFVEQIEAYLKEDQDIGIVVIDVFQIIRSPSKNVKETEYEHAYRDITPLNELAQREHIAIILVCHDRKAVDPDDPFSNILGSTGLQGAATQMMVMYRKRKDDPIHISVKGKTIDGLPELDVKLEDAQWSVVDGADSEARRQEEALNEFKTSDIRLAVVEIANRNKEWRGRCSTLVNDATAYGISVTESLRDVGGFLHRHQGHFLQEDNVQVLIVDNGTGPKIYKIQKPPLMTIDDNEGSPLMGFTKVNNDGGSEIPFL